MFASKLATKAWELLRLRPRTLTYAHISQRTEISVRWLEAFASGQVKDPSASKVERLFEMLSGKSLDV